MEITAIERILGGKKTLHRRIQSKMDLIEMSDKGLTKESLTQLARYMNISMPQISKYLPITVRTIQRYSARKHFNRAVSEHILQIAEVAARGTEVFEDRDKFINWMNLPNKAFGNRAPMSFIGSKFGLDMVLDELGRTEHGLFS